MEELARLEILRIFIKGGVFSEWMEPELMNRGNQGFLSRKKPYSTHNLLIFEPQTILFGS